MIDIKYKSLKLLRIRENNGSHIEISTFLLKKKSTVFLSWERDFYEKSTTTSSIITFTKFETVTVIIYIHITAILCI